MNENYFSNLPKIRFAHMYSAQAYRNVIDKNVNIIELAYLAKGQLHVRDSLCEQTAHQGDILCFLHNEPVLTYSKVPHEHHTVAFELPFDRQLACNDFPLLTPSNADTKRVEQIIDEIIQIFSTDPDRMLFLSSLIFEALNIVCETNKKTGHEGNSYGNIRYTEKAKQYIFENIHRDIRQKEIAEYLEISPQYLCTIFKKTEGVSIINYINRMKMEKIKSLMTRENLKLYEAANLFGYTDPNYVSKLYKKFFHVNITHK